MTRRRNVAIAAALVLGFVAIIASRAVWQGRSALARGDKAAVEGRTDEAISHWRRAARWYLPLAPHVESAYARLEKTATATEEAGDSATALIAWRGIRSSALATRSFFIPHSDRLRIANQRIAAMMAALEGPAADPTKSETERANWHLELLERPVGPSVVFSVIALLGFALWIGAAILFCWLGFDDKDRLNRPLALMAGLLFAAGLVTWLIGLSLA